MEQTIPEVSETELEETYGGLGGAQACVAASPGSCVSCGSS
jgi:hypothetical protein